MHNRLNVQNVRLLVADGTKATAQQLLSTQIRPFVRKIFDKYRDVTAPLLFYDSRVHEEMKGSKKRKSPAKTLPVSEPVNHSRETNVALAPLFDKVLVDAECTHDGSIRHIIKMAENGWKDAEKLLENSHTITELQLELLENGFAALRPGGRLVYSTCSLCTSQNENVITQFLQGGQKGRAKAISCAYLDRCPAQR